MHRDPNFQPRRIDAHNFKRLGVAFEIIAVATGLSSEIVLAL
jgi:hypothetical protein